MAPRNAGGHSSDSRQAALCAAAGWLFGTTFRCTPSRSRQRTHVSSSDQSYELAYNMEDLKNSRARFMLVSDLDWTMVSRLATLGCCPAESAREAALAQSGRRRQRRRKPALPQLLP